MAAKKKTSGKTSDIQKTLAKMEETTKVLQLQIKKLRNSYGNPHRA